MNYKDTLNLPRTSFSMKANLSQNEPRIIDSQWKDIYARIRSQNKGKKKYVLHDGPPYANGKIHIGHALNKILKDIVIKYELLRGHDTPFIIGWDCHGLPVEHQLMKNLKVTKHDVNVSEFRKKAKDFALKYMDLQREDFKRLGVFSDWDNPYLTLNPEYEYGVTSLVEHLAREKYIYRGLKPVNWCAACETALAEAEVEYADKESDSIFFRFKVVDDNDLFTSVREEVSFLVWTTTPWTLLANVAVAVHPDFTYVLARTGSGLLVCARSLVPSLQEILKTDIETVKEFKGRDLEHISLAHPFINRNSQVVCADFVSSEEGSGCVHIAPGHGQEDFTLTRKYDLEIIMPVNDKGRFQKTIAEVEGKNIYEASAVVIEMMKNNGTLLSHKKITHSYPHCWRCKKPIIFRATNQWFLDVDRDDLRQKILDRLEEISWTPASGIERMKAMVANRPDWCLSRQRLWGIPIPAVNCLSCGEAILDAGIVAKAAALFRKNGSDSWFSEPVETFLPEKFSCPHCRNEKFEKTYDILDVWFESGASWASVLKDNPDLAFPADMYLEGSDQHRGWFQVSLILAMAREKKPPFKTILTHGFVVDGEGKKMSKSLGNVISPQEVIRQYGAEIIRLWAACSDYSEDIKLSKEILQQLVDMYRKIRNTIRFILGTIHDFDPETETVSQEEMLELDRYMLARTAQVFEQVTAAYDSFSFYKACQQIFNFCNLEMSSFYLDILKDRLYTYGPRSKERKSAQTVLYIALKTLLKICAPVLSFTAEEAWSAFECLKNRKDSIFLESFDDLIAGRDTELLARWETVLDLREKVLKEIENVRTAGTIGSSLEAALEITVSDKNFSLFSEIKDTLREVFIVSRVTVHKGNFAIEVSKAGGAKCPRCWNWRDDIGCDAEYPDICTKCVNAVKGGRNG